MQLGQVSTSKMFERFRKDVAKDLTIRKHLIYDSMLSFIFISVVVVVIYNLSLVFHTIPKYSSC